MDIPIDSTTWSYTTGKMNGNPSLPMLSLAEISTNGRLLIRRIAEGAFDNAGVMAYFNTNTIYFTSGYNTLNVNYSVDGTCTWNQHIILAVGNLKNSKAMNQLYNDGCGTYNHSGTMQLDISSITTNMNIQINLGISRSNANFQTSITRVWLSN